MIRGAAIAFVMLTASSGAGIAGPAGAGASLTAVQRLGRQVVSQHCGVCHTPPTITAGLYGPPLDQLAGAGSAEVLGTVIADGTPRMPGFKYALSPAEIDAAVQFLKTLSPSPAATSGAGGSR